MNKTYQEENNELLEFIVNKCFLDEMKLENYNTKSEKSIEFIITPECNLKCSYCYINNYGEQLYPATIVNHGRIISNMRKMLSYFKNNDIYMRALNLFSGEIWSSPFGYEILFELLKFYQEYKLSSTILIPSNMTFLSDPEAEVTIQNYIDSFKKINVKLSFSASVDGKVIENSFREFKDTHQNSIRNDQYYKKIFEFCAKNNFLFHPMVSSKSCKDWIKNYDWYVDNLKEYSKNPRLMMLEVRNNDWEDQDISALLDFLKHVINYHLDIVNKGNLEEFSKSVIKLGDKHNYHNNIALTMCNNRLTCAIQKTMYIRLGDLALVPCHRLSYPHHIYGKIKILENQIQINAVNPELATRIYSMNPNVSHPTCDNCSYKYLCIKGCLGSQYETNTDLLQPCTSVCKMLKAKINFLIDTYKNMGVLDVIATFSDRKAVEILRVINEIERSRNE